MDAFPPNSAKAQAPPKREKRVERVTRGEVRQSKKSLTSRFSETFVGGNPKTALDYVIFGVLLPAAKDALVEGASQGFEKLIYGESRMKRSPIRPGAAGHFAYNRINASGPSSEPVISRADRARHDFRSLKLASRQEAEEVLERLYDLVSQFDTATVADLYTLTGVRSTHVDGKWGWTDLRGSSVRRTHDGYLLDLPAPTPLG